MGNAARHKGMNRGFVLAGLLCVVPLFAGFADSFRERIEYGNALLNSGNFEGAREVYRNLQIEHPENAVIYYSLGCADYEEAETAAAIRDVETALEGFASARDAFRQAMASRERWLREDAHYNHANSLAQIAKQTALRGEQEATITAFEEALSAYEDVLERYPEHAEAQHNLEHMRYLLKRMLQDPPPPEEEEPGEEEEQHEQEGDPQEREDGTQEEEPEPRDEPGEEPSQPEPEEQEDEQEPQQQPDQAAAASDEEVSDWGDEEDMQDRQAIEAILQSLEAEDRREQQDLRTSPPDSRIPREWW